MKSIWLEVFLCLSCCLPAQTVTHTTIQWKPGPFQLVTRWSKEVSLANALREYPQMVRSQVRFSTTSCAGDQDVLGIFKKCWFAK